ncbi:MAG: hypothetical protein COA91_04750 [Robiginitomaculum sp.]|nr:MAG: hypothetical protein COA91_04750 [Robiginitomaculum sp.]
MPSWATVLIIAIGGAMLVEGAVYALFPGGMKRAMREMMDMPEGQLRIAGLVVAAIGLALIYFLLPRI